MSAQNELPRPRGICTGCQQSAPAFKHKSGKIAVYCEHNATGGVLQGTTSGPMWTLYTPVSREEFIDSLLEFEERITFAMRAALD